MRHVPLIKSVMTPFPYSIAIDAPIEDAQAMMADHDIRHLPVKDNGKIVSVISERDIRLTLQSGSQHGKEPLRVRDVIVPETYIVELNERLDSVLLHMARHHIGSALVVRNGKLAGIFTMTDACRCYGEYLRSLFPTGNGHDAA